MGLLGSIAEGKYDSSLDRIIRACQERKANRVYELRKGDKVRFPSTSKPSYLAGATATIIEWRRTRVLIELDGDLLFRGRSKRIIAYPQSLEPV